MLFTERHKELLVEMAKDFKFVGLLDSTDISYLKDQFMMSWVNRRAYDITDVYDMYDDDERPQLKIIREKWIKYKKGNEQF
jgi:hypothetical protein